jgi:hypothetical protein
MDDRGEKIVLLAREILRTDEIHLPSDNRAGFAPASVFKAMCLATILTALASSAITYWSCDRARPLNRDERVEIEALIYYAAQQKKLDETQLRRELEQNLNLAVYDDMTAHDLPRARHYLQERALPLAEMDAMR